MQSSHPHTQGSIPNPSADPISSPADAHGHAAAHLSYVPRAISAQYPLYAAAATSNADFSQLGVQNWTTTRPGNTALYSTSPTTYPSGVPHTSTGMTPLMAARAGPSTILQSSAGSYDHSHITASQPIYHPMSPLPYSDPARIATSSQPIQYAASGQLPSYGSQSLPPQARGKSVTFLAQFIPIWRIEYIIIVSDASSTPPAALYGHDQYNGALAPTQPQYSSASATPQPAQPMTWVVQAHDLYFQGTMLRSSNIPNTVHTLSMDAPPSSVEESHLELDPLPYVSLHQALSHTPAPSARRIITAPTSAGSNNVQHRRSMTAVSELSDDRSTSESDVSERSILSSGSHLPFVSYSPQATFSYPMHTDLSPISPTSPSFSAAHFSPSSSTSQPGGPTRSQRGQTRSTSPIASVKKRHVCAICGKSVSRNFDLTRHMESVHHQGVSMSGEERYRCTECGKAFSRRDSLQRHQRDDGCRSTIPESVGTITP